MATPARKATVAYLLVALSQRTWYDWKVKTTVDSIVFMCGYVSPQRAFFKNLNSLNKMTYCDL